MGTIKNIKIKDLTEHLIIDDWIGIWTNSDYWKTMGYPLMENFLKWRESKEERVGGIIDSLDHPLQIDPISVSIPIDYDYHALSDGVTRTRLFLKRGLPEIPAEISKSEMFHYAGFKHKFLQEMYHNKPSEFIKLAKKYGRFGKFL